MVRAGTRFIIKETANPFQIFRSSVPDTGKSCIMQQNQTTASFHLLFYNLQTVTNQEGMVLLIVIRAITVKDNCVSIIQCRGIFGPAVEVDLRAVPLQRGARLNTAGQETRCLLIFMVAGTVAFRSCEEDDLARLTLC